MDKNDDTRSQIADTAKKCVHCGELVSYTKTKKSTNISFPFPVPELFWASFTAFCGVCCGGFCGFFLCSWARNFVRPGNHAPDWSSEVKELFLYQLLLLCVCIVHLLGVKYDIYTIMCIVCWGGCGTQKL